MSTPESLTKIRDNVRTRFEAAKRLLSFEEYFELAGVAPYLSLRDSSHYLNDALNYFGQSTIDVRGQSVKRFKAFDNAFADRPSPVIGQESAQQRLAQILAGFARVGKANKLIVFHGPNGSAKSSLLRTFFDSLEHYSKQPDGRVFYFSWIFPHESVDKTSLGIGAKRDTSASQDQSYAKLEQDRIGAIVRSELHENPLFLIPKEDRISIFDGWMKSASANDKKNLEALREYFLQGELSHKNALIFDALLNEYNGDLKKVLRHVRVERLFFSRRFRKGLVTVEPQFGNDATIRQVTLDRSLANLPPALQSLNLFQLEGDLVDGNRGIIEYNDFLKRPVEHFKYLLGTCESGTVNLGHVVAFLDTIFVATTDERHLEAFREHPEYGSFKARLEFIRVPYLLRYSEEEKIYRQVATAAAGEKELLPHTTGCLALWAVLSRLKRPLTKNKSPMLTKLLEGLTPLVKAKLYDSGELPEGLTDEERRELKAHLEELIEESQNQPYYEGMLGASARELKSLVQAAAQNEQFTTLGPNALFFELKKMVKRPMDFEYLRLEPNHGFHAFEDMIEIVRHEWLTRVDHEMRIALGLQNDAQFADTVARYLGQVTANIRGEKVKNRITGRAEEPDKSFMDEFETFIGITTDQDNFRKNLISRLGAYAIDHKDRDASQPLPYAKVFPDLLDKLHAKHHEQQVSKIKEMGEFLIDLRLLEKEISDESLSSAQAMAKKAYVGLQEKFGYGPLGAKEALVELLKNRYV
jgi:serine protein kinase